MRDEKDNSPMMRAVGLTGDDVRLLKYVRPWPNYRAKLDSTCNIVGCKC